MRILRVLDGSVPSFATLVDEEHVRLLTRAPWDGGTPTDRVLPRAGLTLLAPVTPSKIVCVGRNYAAHAKELGNEVPKEPLLFLKPPSAICHPEQAIVLPPMSERVEHEAEVGVVIGKQLKRASVVEARAGIFGITCVNDVTARDLQKRDVQFTRAKSFDTFCPVGPWIDTDHDLTELEVIARVDGAQRQHGNTRDMVFPVAELIAFISQVMTLEPGDLIATGTPEGVGPLAEGQSVEIEIGGVGVLRNPIVRG